jgi:hypothetical protein
MRCLYCGKELAFLKRWTGGGEFCSDGHRQRYQQEYNQLALTRLLQAKPSSEGKPPAPEAKTTEAKTSGETKPKGDLKPAATKHAEEALAPPQAVHGRATPAVSRPPTAPTTTQATPIQPSPTRQAPYRQEPARREPVRQERGGPQAIAGEPGPSRESARHGTNPPSKPQSEAVAPATLAEFLLELPVPVTSKVQPMLTPELDFLFSGGRALPQRQYSAARIDPATAGQVELKQLQEFTDYATRPSERRLELREFVRTTPIVDLGLRPSGETGLERSGAPIEMEIGLSPQPPDASASWWRETEKEFAAFELELGELARLAFQTTGISENNEKQTPSATEIEVVVETKPGAAPEAPAPEPVVAGVEQPAEKAPEEKPRALPEIVTKPMPITLHGLAAGKAKPVQVFASVASSIRVQIPRSDALPLRPLMTLSKPALAAGPTSSEVRTPEKRTPERPAPVKADPAKPPMAAEPRFANGKVRKQDVRIFTPEKRETAPEKRETEKKSLEKVTRPAAAAATAVKEPPAEAKEGDAKPAPPAAPPTATPYVEPDLGLPTLNLTTSESFWSRLPAAVKITLASVLLLAIGGTIFLTTKGGGRKASSAPQALQAGSTLPAGEGWIGDFSPDPSGGRRRRQVSVLRSSLPLNNYRMELQGQIENKALGWVVRAKDAKNFYAMKLEIVRPGPDPAVDLVRFAVINGEEQPRTQIPLPMPVRTDTLYRVRVDAVGNHFTTWVQDQKVDEWTDGNISAGGAGLYNERGEHGSLRGGVNVSPLAMK